MMLRMPALVAAVAAVPLGASATTVTTIGNQTSVVYNAMGSNIDLGNFDLAIEPVAVSALFIESDVSGQLAFGVFLASIDETPQGSIDVNLVHDNETFSGTFDGTSLIFVDVLGDSVARFATFRATPQDDVARFTLEFTGFDPGDQFQVNVAPIPLPVPVPLPASVLMLLSALGGLAFTGRR